MKKKDHALKKKDHAWHAEVACAKCPDYIPASRSPYVFSDKYDEFIEERKRDESPRAIAIMFDCYEALSSRRCFCGSEDFRRVAANTRGVNVGEYSLTLACCMSCFRLFHLV